MRSPNENRKKAKTLKVGECVELIMANVMKVLPHAEPGRHADIVDEVTGSLMRLPVVRKKKSKSA